MILSDAYAETVHAVLSYEYGRLKHAAELLARDAGVSRNTARNWLDGICSPQGSSLIMLMRSCEKLRQEINNLIDER